MKYHVTIFFDTSDALGRTETHFVVDDQYKVRDALLSSEGMDFVSFHDINANMVIVDRSSIRQIKFIPAAGGTS